MGNARMGHAEDQVTNLAETAKEKLGEVRDAVEGYYEKGVQKAKDFEEDLETRIRDNPIRAVLIAAGIAAGAGLLIGCLLRR
ncbi:MAG TPA: hypothetical protein VMT52_06375 [Planctomycetota bacterium]|nr:hypothetical protein [Planctomycetota bacterium]